MNDELLQDAIAAINKFFSDSSVDKTVTLIGLEELQDECSMLLETLNEY